MERNRLFQLDRLEKEGRVDVEEVDKAVVREIRTAEDEADLAIDLGSVVYKDGQPLNKWKQAAFPEAPWEKSWKEGERIIFDERTISGRNSRNRSTTVYEATRLLARKKDQRRRAGRKIG